MFREIKESPAVIWQKAKALEFIKPQNWCNFMLIKKKCLICFALT